MATMDAAAFPSHQTDPKKKLEPEFMLQFAKAAYASWQRDMPEGSIFFAKRAMYEVIRQYAMNMQGAEQYQKELLPEDEDDESFTTINWKTRADGMVKRNKAVAKLQKAGYNILATPINPAAKDAQDEEYAKAKVKIMMREAMQQQAPEIKHPSLKRMPGEADDLEELQIEIDHSPKFVRAKDIEESVQLVFYENEANKLLDVIAEDFVDFGVGVVKDDLDENNKVVLRQVYPGRFACSHTSKSDFSDITWAWEINKVKLSDLSKYFGPDDLKKMADGVLGQDGNPTSFGSNSIINNGYDIFKVPVMDLEFISWDKRVTEVSKNKFGNLKVAKAKPSAANSTYVNDAGETVEKTQKDSEFISKTVENVYKCKWVVGTDLIYDYGKLENQKRSVNIATMGKTKLSYHIKAASFQNMRATGLTEAMIPIIDDLNSATFKLRMFRNRMVPNGFDIDLSAIEGVALGKGGKKLTVRQVIDMFFETGVLVSRRSGISMDSNVNYKAINAISNNMADQLVSLANDIQTSLQALEAITGLGEITDERALTTVANMKSESTNDALYYLINARRNLIESLAKSTVQRLQVALKRGAYDGFNKATGRWITVPKSIMDYDYDIMIEDKPSEEQKQILYNLMTEDIKNGYISHADVVAIIYTNNLKDAAIRLSYKVDKAKKDQQANSIQNTQVTAQMQIQSNQAAEQVKYSFDEKRHNLKMAEIDQLQSWNYMIAKEKLAQADAAVDKKAITDIIGMLPPEHIAAAAQQQSQQPSPDEPEPQQNPQEEMQEQPAMMGQ
jgi:hypothetical protein